MRYRQDTAKAVTLQAVNTGSRAYKTPPSSPETIKEIPDTRKHGNRGLDESPLIVLGKHQSVEEYQTPGKMIRSVAEELLQISGGASENEIEDGHIYAFSVPGNESLVKLGFTTRKVDTRIEEWQRRCEQVPAVLDLGMATQLVPHAHRVERLVHAELMEHRVCIYCAQCRTQHNEWFEVPEALANASVKR